LRKEKRRITLPKSSIIFATASTASGTEGERNSKGRKLQTHVIKRGSENNFKTVEKTFSFISFFSLINNTTPSSPLLLVII